MKNLYFINVLLLLFVCSCSLTETYDEDCSDFDYSNCNTLEPYFIDLKIKLSTEYGTVPLLVYVGNIEDNIIEYVDTATESPHYISVPVNNTKKKYTVSAEYHKNGKTIIAIDATQVRKKSKTQCDSTCWSTTGGQINLRLKD